MPFTNTADPRFFFKTAEHEEALAALLYGVTQRRGMTLVIGQPGSGKTLLGYMLLQSLQGGADVAMIVHTPETGHELLYSICGELCVRCRNSMTTGELVDRLREHLAAHAADDRATVVVIDEAQALKPDVLEHLRMLGNLERDSAKLLQIVLLGQPEFLRLVQQPQFDQLRQRIYCVCQLKPLARDQVRNYIRHRLKVAGSPDLDLFTDEAIDLIHDRSEGLPRLINQIADNALLAAYGASNRKITRETVATCISEMMHVQTTTAPQEAGDAVSPLAPSQTAVSTSLMLESAMREAAHSARSLNNAIQAGAESSGRLGEMTCHATRQAASLAELLARAESTIQSLRDSHELSLAAAGKAAAESGELRRLFVEAGQQSELLETRRAEAAQSADDLADAIRRAEEIAARVLAAGPEAAREATLAGERLRPLIDQVAGRAQELQDTLHEADAAGRRLNASVRQAGESTEQVQAAAADSAARQTTIEEALRRCREQVELAGSVADDVGAATTRLREALAGADAAERICREQAGVAAQSARHIAGELARVVETTAQAENLRRQCAAGAQDAREVMAALQCVLSDAAGQRTGAEDTLRRQRESVEVARATIQTVEDATARLAAVLRDSANAERVCRDQISAASEAVHQIEDGISRTADVTVQADAARRQCASGAQEAREAIAALQCALSEAAGQRAGAEDLLRRQREHVESARAATDEVDSTVARLGEAMRDCLASEKACREQVGLASDAVRAIEDGRARSEDATRQAEGVRRLVVSAALEGREVATALQAVGDEAGARRAEMEDMLRKCREQIDAVRADVEGVGTAAARLAEVTQQAAGTEQACREQVSRGTRVVQEASETVVRLDAATRRAEQAREMADASAAAASTEVGALNTLAATSGEHSEKLRASIRAAEHAEQSLGVVGSSLQRIKAETNGVFQQIEKRLQAARGVIGQIEERAQDARSLAEESARSETSWRTLLEQAARVRAETTERLEALQVAMQSAIRARAVAEEGAASASRESAVLGDAVARAADRSRDLREGLDIAVAQERSLRDAAAAGEEAVRRMESLFEAGRARAAEVEQLNAGMNERGEKARLLLEELQAIEESWSRGIEQAGLAEARLAAQARQLEEVAAHATQAGDAAQAVVQEQANVAAEIRQRMDAQVGELVTRIDQIDGRRAVIGDEAQAVVQRLQARVDAGQEMLAAVEERTTNLARLLQSSSRAEAAAHEQMQAALRRTGQISEQMEQLETAAARVESLRQAVEQNAATAIARSEQVAENLERQSRGLAVMLEEAARREERLSRLSAEAERRIADADVAGQQCRAGTEAVRIAADEAAQMANTLRVVIEEGVRGEAGARTRMQELLAGCATAGERADSLAAAVLSAGQVADRLTIASDVAASRTAAAEAGAARLAAGTQAVESLVHDCESRRIELAKVVSAAAGSVADVERAAQRCTDANERVARMVAEIDARRESLAREAETADRTGREQVQAIRGAIQDAADTLTSLKDAGATGEQTRQRLASSIVAVGNRTAVCESVLMKLEAEARSLQTSLEEAGKRRTELSEAMAVATSRIAESRAIVGSCTEQVDRGRKAVADMEKRAAELGQDAQLYGSEAQERLETLADATARAGEKVESLAQTAASADEAGERLASVIGTAGQQAAVSEALSGRLERQSQMFSELLTRCEEHRVRLDAACASTVARTSETQLVIEQSSAHIEQARRATAALQQEAARCAERTGELDTNVRRRLDCLEERLTFAGERLEQMTRATDRAEQVQQSLRAGVVAAAADAGSRVDEMTRACQQARSTQEELMSGAQAAAVMAESVAAQMLKQAESMRELISQAEAASTRMNELQAKIDSTTCPEAIKAIESRQAHLHALLERARQQTQVISQAVDELGRLREELGETSSSAGAVRDSLTQVAANAEQQLVNISQAIEQSHAQVTAIVGETRSARNASFALSRARQELEFTETASQQYTQQFARTIEQMEQRCARLEDLILRSAETAPLPARHELRNRLNSPVGVAERSIEAVSAVRQAEVPAPQDASLAG